MLQSVLIVLIVLIVLTADKQINWKRKCLPNHPLFIIMDYLRVLGQTRTHRRFSFYSYTHNCIRHNQKTETYIAKKRIFLTLGLIGSHKTISRAAIEDFTGHMRPAGRMLCRPAVKQATSIRRFVYSLKLNKNTILHLPTGLAKLWFFIWLSNANCWWQINAFSSTLQFGFVVKFQSEFFKQPLMTSDL